jgi:hypothetical protein
MCLLVRVVVAFSMFAAAGSAFAADGWLGVAQELARTSGAAIDFTPHGSQPGLLYSFLPSDGDCISCHGAGGAGNTQAFRPHPTWAGSMMANSTRDPLFWAALDVANHDVPGVGDFCLRCHTSDGWYGGRVVKQGFGLPDNDVGKGAAGCLLQGSPDAPDNYNDYSGLGCHFCHRNMPQGPGGEPLPRNGAVWLDDTDCNGRGEPCRRGPYTYSGGQPPHAWAKSPFHEDSAMCGQCHDVSTPDTSAGPLKTLKLADGSDTGLPFPIERTFTEWTRSSFSASPGGKSCQACHMPTSTDPQATACSLGGYPNRSGNLPTHAFAGGNTWMPGVIKGEFSDTSAIPGSAWGVGRQDSYDQTVEWARQMLQSAATVATTVTAYTAPTAGSAGSLALNVKVTNVSGHKLPTGYGEGRRMWLNVQVKDASGALVAESAAYDAGSGVLAADPQARVYEVLQGIWNHNGSNTCDIVDGAGKPMFHFALNDCVAKDNRIPPLGFKPATADDPQGYEVRPVPQGLYPETTPGSGVLVNYDQAAYSFTIPAGKVGPFTATARLYYQTASRDYVEFLRNEAVANGFQGENQMCSGESNRPFVVGPKERTRGQYLFELWNDPTPAERVFADAFDGVRAPTGYGKSPPELMQFGSATTAP